MLKFPKVILVSRSYGIFGPVRGCDCGRRCREGLLVRKVKSKKVPFSTSNFRILNAAPQRLVEEFINFQLASVSAFLRQNLANQDIVPSLGVLSK